MTTLLRVLPERWQNQRTVNLLLRLGVIAATLFLAYWWGRRPSLEFAAIPVILVTGWMVMLNPHWGPPALIVAAMLVPFGIGTGTLTSLNAAFLLVPAVVGVWLVRSLLSGSIKLAQTPANWALLALVVTATLSLLNGYLPWNVFATLAPVRAQLGAWAIFVVSALTFVMGANMIPNVRWLKLLVFLFIGLGAVHVASVTFGPVRFLEVIFVFGMNGSLFWLWVVALAAGQALFNRSLGWPWRVVMGLIVYYTIFNRLLPRYEEWASGWFPSFIALGVVAAARWPRLAVIGAIAGAIGAAIYFPEIQAGLLAGNEYSLITRSAASSIVLEIVRASPLLGVGPANYYFYTPLYAILGWYVRFNSHNQYIDILAQTGLAGIVCIVIFAVIMARTALRQLAQTKTGFEAGFIAGCLGGLVATLVAGWLGDWFLPFVYNLGITGFRSSLLVWLFLGGLVALGRMQRQPTASPAPQ